MPPSDRPKIWAYAYRLTPPLAPARLRELKRFLALEHASARERHGTWEARFVTDERVAHILVLSDSPNLDCMANKRIEEELTRLQAGFSLTLPLAVEDGGDDIPQKK